MYRKDIHEYLYENKKMIKRLEKYSTVPRICLTAKDQQTIIKDIDNTKPLNEINISELVIYTNIGVLKEIYQNNIFTLEQLLSINEIDFKNIFGKSKYKNQIKDLIELMNCKFNFIYNSGKLKHSISFYRSHGHPEIFFLNMCFSRELASALVEYISKYKPYYFEFEYEYATDILRLAQDVEENRSDLILPPQLKNEFIVKSRIFANYYRSRSR